MGGGGGGGEGWGEGGRPTKQSDLCVQITRGTERREHGWKEGKEEGRKEGEREAAESTEQLMLIR